MKFIVFDAKQSPTDNFNTWSAQVKAHPDALAYVGPGSQAAVSLSRISAPDAARSTSSAPATSTRWRSRASRTASSTALVSPEHWLKGYLAIKLMADSAQSDEDLPEGMWNSGALIVNSKNIDEIIARQKGEAERAEYFKDEVEKQLGEPRTSTSGRCPVTDARGTRRPQDLRRRRGAGRRGPHGPRRLGARAAGRERRRQVDAGEGDRGRADARRGDDHARRAGGALRDHRRGGRASGVAVVSQELNVFPDLDVLANLYTMRELKRGPFVVAPRRWRRTRGRCCASSGSTSRCGRRSRTSAWPSASCWRSPRRC